MTYKTEFILVSIFAVVIIIYAAFKLYDNKEIVTETAPIEFMNSVDNYGNNFTVEYYPEEGFCILSIYMEESKTHMWKWSNYKNEIDCNYIHYQDDHYVVSFKPIEGINDLCQATLILTPIEEGHSHDTLVLNSYMVEIGYPEEGGYGFNVYPAEYTTSYEEGTHEHTHE